MRKFAFIALMLSLAGCGPAMEWYRPNTSVDAARQDAAECRGEARDEAFRESFFYGPPFYSFPYYGARGSRYWRDPLYDPFFAREMREQSLQEFCLRSRGYRLVPVQKQGAPQ